MCIIQIYETYKKWKKALIILAQDLCVYDAFIKQVGEIKEEKGYNYYQKIIIEIYKEKWK